MRLSAGLVLSSLVLLPAALSATPINLSTGQGAAGTADPLYQVAYTGSAANLNPSGAVAASILNPNGAWSAQSSYNPSGANWDGFDLSSATGSDPGGYYTYTTTFSTGTAGAVLTGDFAADNSVQVYLNGTFTGIYDTYSNGYSSLTPFTLTTGFANGLNTLQFVVLNGNNANDTAGPAGLLADVTATTTPVTATTPEPSSIALLGTGLAGAAGLARRRPRHL